MLKGSCSMARRCSRSRTLGTCSRMVLLVWGTSSGSASPCCAWRTVSGSLVRPLSGMRTPWKVRRPLEAADVQQGLVQRVVSPVSFAFLSGCCYAVGVPFLKLVAAGGEEHAAVGVSLPGLRCAGVQQGGEFLFCGPNVMDELLECEVWWCSRVAGVALHAACLCRPAHGGGGCGRIRAVQDGV